MCSSRELQFLADQESISPAAIKRTTLDKVLAQPGVGGVGGVPVVTPQASIIIIIVVTNIITVVITRTRSGLGAEGGGAWPESTPVPPSQPGPSSASQRCFSHRTPE